MAEVHLEGVVKRYGSFEAVHSLDLAIAHNEFVVLVGPSGCGKSTTLRMIAGLEPISGGVIRIGGRVVNHLAPRDRNISMVFQNYALYPHMTVEENQGFGLKIAGRPKPEIAERVMAAARTLGLEGMLDRRPAHLSGGQRQRVAMGRAIVRDPDAFLFDEPLSNLDAKLRTQMRTEIKRLHQKVETTIVYVTHDQVEAMTLADRIVVMRDGWVEQVGSPLDIFHHPVNTFVAGFLGSPPMNLLDGTIEAGPDGPTARVGPLSLPLPPRFRQKVNDGQRVVVGFRPEAVAPFEQALEAAVPHRFVAPVTITEPLGSEALLFFRLGEAEAIAKVFRPRTVIADGVELDFLLDLDELHLFDPRTGDALDPPPDRR